MNAPCMYTVQCACIIHIWNALHVWNVYIYYTYIGMYITYATIHTCLPIIFLDPTGDYTLGQWRGEGQKKIKAGSLIPNGLWKKITGNMYICMYDITIHQGLLLGFGRILFFFAGYPAGLSSIPCWISCKMTFLPD